MLTREENDLLTKIGPGTPAGNLLRHYWYPVAPVPELSAEHPTRFVRLLGEDLVLFRSPIPSPSGGRGEGEGAYVGLVGDHCPHRGASLLYGRVEERGIACAYHGWLYDTRGNCLETPAEPADSKLYLTVKHTAYPVRQFIGLYWAYLGPEPVPEIPPYDLWVRKDGRRSVQVQPRLDCNWLQPMENSVDPSHSRVLHADVVMRRGGPPLANTTRGLTDDIEYFDFSEVPVGIMKKRVSKNGHVDEHPLVFPNILRHGNDTQIRVPIDDTHTQVFFVHFVPNLDGSLVDEDESVLPVTYFEQYKEPVEGLHPFTQFTMHDVQPQDHMAWETQGPIANRANERLATSDRGILMLRDMLKREIGKVQRGLEPMNVYRDPARPAIDSNHTVQMAEWAEINRGRRATVQV